MKKYEIKYFCHISKGVTSKITLAENKTDARSKFKKSCYVAPKILDIVEIKE